MAGAAIAGAAGSIISGVISASATKSAASKQLKGTLSGIEEQRRQFDLGREDLAPFREAGQGAVNFLSEILLPPGATGTPFDSEITSIERELTSLTSGRAPLDISNEKVFRLQLVASGVQGDREEQRNARRELDQLQAQSIAPSAGNGARIADLRTRLNDLQGQARDFGADAQPPDAGALLERASPGFRFRQAEGEKAIDRRNIAGGNFLSGRGVKEALRFNQDFASNEFDNFISRLFGLSGLGSGATQVGVQSGQQNANAVSNLFAQGGANQATIGLQGAANMNNAIQGGLSNYVALQQQQQLLDALGSTNTASAAPAVSFGAGNPGR